MVSGSWHFLVHFRSIFWIFHSIISLSYSLSLTPGTSWFGVEVLRFMLTQFCLSCVLFFWHMVDEHACLTCALLSVLSLCVCVCVCERERERAHGFCHFCFPTCILHMAFCLFVCAIMCSPVSLCPSVLFICLLFTSYPSLFILLFQHVKDPVLGVTHYKSNTLL